MQEIIEKPDYKSIDFRDANILDSAIFQAEAKLKKDYLSVLKEYHVADIPEQLKTLDIAKCASFFDITKLVYTKEENYLDKLTTIANAVYVSDSTLVSAIICDGFKTRFLLGIVQKHCVNDMSEYANNLQGAVLGNFTGSVMQSTNINSIVKQFDEYRVVSAISNVPSERNEVEDINQYIQGIEKLVDALGNREYCILTIADSIPLLQCNDVRNSLCDIYKQLSGFSKTEITINENYSVADSETVTENYSKSIGTNVSHSQAHTNQTGWSTNETEGTSQNRTAATITKMIGMTAVAAASVAATPESGGASAVVGGASIIGIANTISAAFGQESESYTNGSTGSVSDMDQFQTGQNTQEQEGYANAKGTVKTIGKGKSLSFSIDNKSVSSILDEIDNQLERLNKCINYGAFNSCTYILSKDSSTNMLASNMFNALIAGEDSGIQNPKVNIWGIVDAENYNVRVIKEYLRKFTHPEFYFGDKTNVVTSSSLVNGRELAIQMGFPKRSISGLSVVYKVPFGRNVVRASKSEKTLALGNICNLGSVTKERVEIDLKSLTSHAFVTGSTGTGKSNAMCKILETIQKNDPQIHFMVIEPAKGEYKHDFCLRKDVVVYGTNPKKTRLLKINPFSFPEDVHVLEHVDRLVEIMNVCWPMYAAMPAILKNAVIKSYEKCGWDVANSYVPRKEKLFPNFADVLENINEILNSSAFSQDNKGDYVGALCTRVESLMYGLNGQMFVTDEIPSEELFDENVIVDLSRVGATDTKSLIMGILVMKLQEYRMSQNLTPNQNLKHVMVLEEAHNLLKKTSTDQSMEGSNLAGKSVEMITNAIAEMRTYGEGFFIVDQAPDLLDKAVIRNTNTKIVLRLPEDQDRVVVGKSMGLNDEQIMELSKLDLGCAVVYQNDWEEAVLCKFEKYHKDNANPDNDSDLFVYKDVCHVKSQSEIKKDILRLVMDISLGNKVDDSRIAVVSKELRCLQISVGKRKRIDDILKNRTICDLEKLADFIGEFYDCDKSLEKCKNAPDIKSWNNDILYAIDPELRKMSQWYMDTFVQCVLIEYVKKNPEFGEYADKWKNAMEVK